ncbi:MAG: response regulator [Candidatus Kariarchaeaceae archaeon]
MSLNSKIPILLVEDDIIDVKTIKRAFKRNRITNPLFVVSHGKMALDYLEQKGDFSDTSQFPRPGFIILDLNMPVMNGLEFLKIVKSLDDFKRIPVFVLTTSIAENDRVQSYNYNVAGYITKPIDFEEFVESVRKLGEYWNLIQLP